MQTTWSLCGTSFIFMCLRWNEITTLVYSILVLPPEYAPWYSFSIYPFCFIKMQKLVKEIDEGEMPKISSFTHFHFSLWKIHRNENWVLMGDVGNKSPFGSHADYPAYFSTWSSWSVAIQYLRWNHISSLLLKHGQLERAFQMRNLDIFLPF